MDKGYIYQDTRYLVSEFYEVKIRNVNKKTEYAQLNEKKLLKDFITLLNKEFQISLFEREVKKAVTLFDLVELLNKKINEGG